MRTFGFGLGLGRHLTVSLVTGLLVAAVAMPAWAQDEEADNERDYVDEIIVTATKREQSIQDVPIAISAFGSEELTDRGVEDLADLQSVSPSLIIGSSNSNSNGGVIRIRGMGTSGNNAGLESAVGVFIDGVFRSRAGLAFQDLVDIERVEVLRGPQGTLFGKNTSAGAVSIITKKPAFDFGGFGSVSYGSRNARKVQASVTGPLIDDVLAYRIAGSWHKRDGYFKQNNFRTEYPSTFQALGGAIVPHPRAGEPVFDRSNGDRDFSGRDRWTMKAQLMWTPTEDFDARLIVDYTEHREDCCPAGFSALDRNVGGTGLPGPATAYELLIGQTLSTDAKSHDVGANFAPREDITDKGVSLESNWNINEAVTMTTVFAVRNFEVFRTQDVDFSEADVLQGIDVSETWDNWSAEVRFVGTYEGLFEGLDWLIGFYAFNEEVDQQGQVSFGTEGAFLSEITTFGATAGLLNTVFGAGDGNYASFTQDTRSYAAFTHNQLFITEDLDLTIGARFTWEEKEASQRPQDGRGAAARMNFTNPMSPDPASITNHAGCAGGALLISLRNAFGATCDNFAWEDEFDNTEWSFFASLGYQLNEDHNMYLAFAHGFKSGGWNANANSLQITGLTLAPGPCASGTTATTTTDGLFGCIADGRSFDPEFTNNFELGLKSKFFDGALTVNTTLFHTVFKNYQLQTFTGLFFFINNVPRVKARGIELEGRMLLSESSGFTFSVTYADTRYGSNLFITPDPALGSDGIFGTTDDKNGLDHQTLNGAPVWSGSIGMFHDIDLVDGWVLGTTGNLLYRGRTNAGSNLDPRKQTGDFTTVNVTLSLRSPDERWELAFWGENLFDTRNMGQFDSVLGNPAAGSPPGGGNLSAFVSAGRFFGVTLKHTFGEGD
jgi:outer membrane receptor protein involved in Fe transport